MFVYCSPVGGLGARKLVRKVFIPQATHTHNNIRIMNKHITILLYYATLRLQ